MFLDICLHIHSVVFAISRHINKQKYAKTLNLRCAGNKVFVKYQAQGEGFNPKHPLAYAFELTHILQCVIRYSYAFLYPCIIRLCL